MYLGSHGLLWSYLGFAGAMRMGLKFNGWLLQPLGAFGCPVTVSRTASSCSDHISFLSSRCRLAQRRGPGTFWHVLAVGACGVGLCVCQFWRCAQPGSVVLALGFQGTGLGASGSQQKATLSTL